MKLINCTPHVINVVTENGSPILQLPKGDIIPRLSQETRKVGTINGVPITSTSFGETKDLPEQKADVFLIVSRLVMAANPNRTDLLVPNGLVRNEKGQILGCTSFAKD